MIRSGLLIKSVEIIGSLTLSLLLFAGCTSTSSEVSETETFTDQPTTSRPAERDEGSSELDLGATDALGLDSSSSDSGAELNLVDMSPEVINEPVCDQVDCGPHGTCVESQQQATCSCEARYVSRDLTCEPEDLDQDGVHFLDDCDDQDPEISPNMVELCDQKDQDCDGRVDEEACSIWVLSPLSNEWSAYALDVSGSVNLPAGPIKAAWDIEGSDIGFVLTQSGYHELRLSSLTWSPARPLSDLLIPNDAPLQHAAFADSVPASHTRNDYESVTINLVDGAGTKRVWVLKYILASGRYERKFPDRLIAETHIWREEHSDEYSPNPAYVRAGWTDVENQRYILNINPQEFCNAGVVTSDIYIALLTSERIHMLEAGSCFDFVPPISIAGSPLDLPNAPHFEEVGAAFWHQGSLYLFRGD